MTGFGLGVVVISVIGEVLAATARSLGSGSAGIIPTAGWLFPLTRLA